MEWNGGMDYYFGVLIYQACHLKVYLRPHNNMTANHAIV